jgi:hypothetical protein
MSFGVKNGPLTYEHAISKTFCKQIDLFIKVFLNDFTIYIFNSMDMQF